MLNALLMLAINKHLLGKNSDKINRKKLEKAFVDYGLKPSSAKVYADELRGFCKRTKTTPQSLLEMNSEEIEDLTEIHTRKYNKGRVVNGDRVPPKRLNVQISSLKA